MNDTQISLIIDKELIRQREHIELIASENFVSRDVLEACGSILTNKYAEGYPAKRYYGGCEYVDEIESLAIERAKILFNAEHANVQPHSGSQANMGVYLAILDHQDTVLGMDLSSGGHLTHGHKLNFSGINYNFISYGVDKETEMIDYVEVRKLANQYKPKLIVAGASAYSRFIDFKIFREIADECGAYLMVDMAHIAGLVAAKLHPSPVPYADFVTSTTHKTLRGPDQGFILCKQRYASLIDKRVFPGMQGGPLMHIIAAKAICFKEALEPSFIDYQNQVIKNAKVLAKTIEDEGLRIVSGGTDNHLLLVDLRNAHINGKAAEKLLHSCNITTNKNSIPFDEEKPFVTSGIRLGTAAMTTRGFNEEDFIKVGKIITKALMNKDDEQLLNSLKLEVLDLLIKFPLYK